MTAPVDETQGRPVEVTCPGCFHPREWDVAAACPICKYRAHSDRSGALLAVGTPLKRYVIGEKLGQGGFGITYRGFDVKLHMKVAIKEYYPSDFVGRSVDRKTVVLNAREHEELFDYGLKAFLKEARTLAQVKHPHLVRVLNYFEMHQTAYLVMDYLEGEDLATHLKRQPGGRLPWRQAVTLMLPVLDGLRKVHEAGFMHRDLKPGNFYWTPEGLVLLDFGAARQVSSDHSRSLLIYSSGYAPYEQCLQGNLRRQGPWTDVYGIAATLYFMLTARRPPSGLDRQQNVRSKQPDPLQPTRRFVPMLPPALDVVLGRALAVEPEQRLQSVVEFKQQLEAVLAEEEKREEEKGTGAKPQPLGGLKRPTKLNLRAAVIAGMVGVLAWGGWWIGFGRSPDPPHPKAKPVTVTPPVAATPPSVETPTAVETPPVAATPLTVETPTAVTTPPVVETTPTAVETPPVAATLPAVETPSVVPSSTAAVPPAAATPPAVETPPPAVETPPVVEPVATAAAPPTSDDTARQKRLDLQLAVAKKLLEARKIRAARRALEDAKALDQDGRVEAFRREQTAILQAAALAFLDRGQRSLAKRVVDDLGQWDSQSPEHRALRTRLTSKQ